MQTIQLPRVSPNRGESVTKLWLAPGGARVAAVLGEGVEADEVAAAVCWDAATGRAVWEIDLDDSDNEYAVPDFDRDLSRVMYESRGNWAWNTSGDVRVRDLASGREAVLAGRPYLPTMSPDGRFVVAAATPQNGVGGLRRWTLPDVLPDTGVELAPDKGWVIRQPNPRGDVRQLDVMLTALSVSPDGGRIAGVRYSGKLAVWGAGSRKELATVVATKPTKYMRYPVYRPTFAPDGALLAALTYRRKAGNRHHEVGIWSVKGGLKQKGPKEKESVNGIAFSPDGRTLLTAREGGTVGVWDVATWKLRREYAWKIGKLYSVAFAPDGLTCAAGGEKGRVVVWDAE